jgi:hypothetical protein
VSSYAWYRVPQGHYLHAFHVREGQVALVAVCGTGPCEDSADLPRCVTCLDLVWRDEAVAV